MLVSVVTAVRDGAATLERNIDSVLALKRRFPVEHLVIEGHSTDRTLAILERRRAEIETIRTHQPGGICEAFNTGITLASGRYIVMLNADDYFLEHGAACALQRLEGLRDGAIAVAGVRLVDPRTGDGEDRLPDPSKIARFMSVYHAATFVPAPAYRSIGPYDTGYRYAMDSEWFHRACAGGCEFEVIPEVVSCVGLRGTSHRNLVMAMHEFRRSTVAHGHVSPASGYFYQVRQTLAHLILSSGPVRRGYLRLRKRLAATPGQR